MRTEAEALCESQMMQEWGRLPEGLATCNIFLDCSATSDAKPEKFGSSASRYAFFFGSSGESHPIITAPVYKTLYNPCTVLQQGL